MQLDENELEIYSRQLLVKGWGLKQQLALKQSVVLIHSENEVVARYLISAGIGHIILKSKALQKELKGFELNTKIDFYDDLKLIPEIDHEIFDQTNSKDTILQGITEALKTITILSKFIGS